MIYKQALALEYLSNLPPRFRLFACAFHNCKIITSYMIHKFYDKMLPLPIDPLRFKK